MAAKDDKRIQQTPTTFYDKNVDYGDLRDNAANNGDYQSAAYYEYIRNAKIDGEGMDPKLKTNTYTQYLPQSSGSKSKQTGIIGTINEKMPGLVDNVVDAVKGDAYTYHPERDPQYTAAKAQQDAIFDKIMNRDPFSYDPESDPLYLQYRDMYTRNGRIAMRDTMGQAAALTGGYGSTYSQAAGQQSYDAYIARLNDVLPDLYGQAYDRWNAEGNNLLNQYNMAAAQAGDIYNQGYNNWYNNLQLRREDENTAWQRQQYADEQARQDEATAWERQQYADEQAYQKQQDSRNYLLTLITETGYQPTDADLAAAGMTRSEANALYQRYLLDQQASNNSGSGGGSGRGSSGRSGRSYSGSGSGTPTVKPEISAEEAYKQQVQQCYKSLDNTRHYGGTNQQLMEQIIRWVEEGTITQATADEMVKKYGLNNSAKSNSSAGNANGSGNSKINTKGAK